MRAIEAARLLLLAAIWVTRVPYATVISLQSVDLLLARTLKLTFLGLLGGLRGNVVPVTSDVHAIPLDLLMRGTEVVLVPGRRGDCLLAWTTPCLQHGGGLEGRRAIRRWAPSTILMIVGMKHPLEIRPEAPRVDDVLDAVPLVLDTLRVLQLRTLRLVPLLPLQLFGLRDYSLHKALLLGELLRLEHRVHCMDVLVGSAALVVGVREFTIWLRGVALAADSLPATVLLLLVLVIDIHKLALVGAIVTCFALPLQALLLALQGRRLLDLFRRSLTLAIFILYRDGVVASVWQHGLSPQLVLGVVLLKDNLVQPI